MFILKAINIPGKMPRGCQVTQLFLCKNLYMLFLFIDRQADVEALNTSTQAKRQRFLLKASLAGLVI